MKFCWSLSGSCVVFRGKLLLQNRNRDPWHSDVLQLLGEDFLDLFFWPHLDSGSGPRTGLAEMQTSAAVSIRTKIWRCFIVVALAHCVCVGSHSTYNHAAFKVMSAVNISWQPEGWLHNSHRFNVYTFIRLKVVTLNAQLIRWPPWTGSSGTFKHLTSPEMTSCLGINLEKQKLSFHRTFYSLYHHK